MTQILARGCAKSGHRCTVSTLNCNEVCVNVYDSAFDDIDQESKAQKASIFKYDSITSVDLTMQSLYVSVLIPLN